MNQYNSYYLYQQYEKRGDQDWLPVYPNVFSVDGEGTMPLVIKKENDPDCGYVPPVEPMYRWYPLPISTDYVCDECPAVIYRWENINISTDYVCVGTDKYYKQKRQYSYDSGTTWYDVTPPETQTGSLYQTGSTDCGYVPPIEPQYRTTSGTPYCEGYDKYVDVYSQVSYDGGVTWSTTATTPTLVEAQSTDCGYVPPVTTYKFLASYSDSEDYHIDCNSSTVLTSGETKSHGNYQHMTSAIIGSCVESLGYQAFSQFYALSSITIPNSVISIDNWAFYRCNSITDVTLPNSITSIGSHTFAYCISLTRINIPNNITSINSGTFGSCSALTDVIIPSSVETIGYGVFDKCYSLTACTIGNGVNSIGDSAFHNCTGLTDVIIPSSVATIGTSAFTSCSGLTTCTIGSGITSIDNGAFAFCPNLISLTVNAITPPTLGSIVFYYSPNAIIYVPAQSLETYKSSSGWSSYSSRIQAIPSS